MFRLLRASLVASTVVAALAGPAQAAPAAPAADGELDTTWAGYGANSQVIVDFPGALATAVPYQDGVIALGGNGSDFVIAMYTADGQLDTAYFGGDGIATVDFGGVDSAVAVRPYGGQFFVTGPAGGNFGLAKVNGDGTLDNTFDGDGKVTVDFNGQFDEPVAVLLIGDGNVLMAGTATEAGGLNCNVVQCDRNFALARVSFYTGALDSTFDTDGKVQTDLGDDEVLKAATYSGGSIVAAGMTCAQFDCSYLIASYTQAGLPNNGFNGNGLRTGTSALAITAIYSTPDIKILVAGPTEDGFVVMRFNSNGSFDGTFGGGAVTSSWGDSDLPNSIERTLNGEWIVGGGTDGNRFAFTRFNDLGTQIFFFQGGAYIDTTFAGASGAVLTKVAELADGRLWGMGRITVDGQVKLAMSRHFGSGLADAGGWQLTDYYSEEALSDEEARATVFQPDGKLVVAGTFTAIGGTDGGIGLVRYTADGDLDPTFSGVGIVYQDLIDPVVINDMALQIDGKIVVAGYLLGRRNNAPDYDFLAARFNTDGSPDMDFGNGGVALFSISTSDKANGIAIQPDGKILLVGEGTFPGTNPAAPGLFVVRLLSTGDPDLAFTNGFGDGFTGAYSYAGELRGTGIALQPDGKIVAVGVSHGDFVVYRFTDTGAYDLTFHGVSVVYTDFGGTDGAEAVVIQPDGAILVYGDNNQSVLFARYLSNGDPDNSFDTDGKLALTGGPAESHALALHGTTILAVACESHLGQRLAGLYRLNDDGSPVTPGQPFEDFDLSERTCMYDLAVRPGRIAMAGEIEHNTVDFGVAIVQAGEYLYLPLAIGP